MRSDILASERVSFADSSTGAEVIQWTQAPGKNQHLYFTSPSVTSDNRWLVFLSERDGHPNLHAIARGDGSIRRLSNNQDGLLRSYVYPRGGLSGLSKASPCLDPVRNRIFFIRNDHVFRIDLDDPEPGEKVLCGLPSGWLGAYTHVSPDGKMFCVPCTDARAFADETTQWEQLARVPPRIKRQGLVTRLYFIDGESGAVRAVTEVPFWVTHVQFDPAGSGRVVFNCEGHEAGKPLPNRIWRLEPDFSYHPLSPEEPDEWRSHENWAPDGKSIVYHGRRKGRAFVAARSWDGHLLQETPLDGVEFWHATGLPDGHRVVLDCCDGMISLLDPKTSNPSLRLENLCRHDTTYEDQDAHAHPLARPGGGSIVFTSNRSGYCQVYEVAIPAVVKEANGAGGPGGNGQA